MPRGEYIRTTEMCKNISNAKKGKNNGLIGEKHPFWKGDNVSYRSLHEYMRKIIPIPKRCSFCKKVKILELMNMTGIYNREIKNWKYGCRKCHMTIDGRMKNIHYPRYGENNPFFGRKSEMLRDDKGRFLKPKWK